MTAYLYEARAWQELKKMVEEKALTDESFKEIQDLMSDLSYKNFKKRTNPKDVVGTLEGFANSSLSFEGKEFAKLVTSLHPTLQQSVFRLFLTCIPLWTEKHENGYYDLRNEQTVKLSSKINEVVKNEGIPLI